MADRKPWELTDEEIRELMVTVSTRRLVTAAARKALEHLGSEITTLKWSIGADAGWELAVKAVAEHIRKELNG